MSGRDSQGQAKRTQVPHIRIFGRHAMMVNPPPEGSESSMYQTGGTLPPAYNAPVGDNVQALASAQYASPTRPESPVETKEAIITTPLKDISEVALAITGYPAEELRIVYNKDPGGKFCTFDDIFEELSKATKTEYPEEFGDLIIVRESKTIEFNNDYNTLVDEYHELQKKYNDFKRNQPRQ